MTTAYDFLLKILGLWFVNYTSHKISRRFGHKRDQSPGIDALGSPPLSHYVMTPASSSSSTLQSDAIELQTLPELTLPPPIGMSQSFLPGPTEQRCLTVKCVKTVSYYLLNILYIVFILTMICWKPIYKVINIGLYPHWMSNTFIYIIPIQYFVELVYFRTSHFYRTLSTNPAYTHAVNSYSKCVLVASLLASTLSVFLYVFTNYLDIYQHVKDGASLNRLILFGVVCVFEHFYSYCIFFCSIFTFSTVFTIHSMTINRFAKFVNDMEYDVASINKIYNQYNNHKRQYEKSVDHLNMMFATTTLLGFIASYGVFVHVPRGDFIIDVFDILYIILYILAEIVYFYSIYKVRKAITTIQTTIFSGTFARKYLTRQPFQEPTMTQHPSMKNVRDIAHPDDAPLDARFNEISVNINRINKHISCISANVHDSLTSGDWIIMSRVMAEPWKNFALLGFEVEGTTFIKRIGAIVFLYISTSRFQERIDLHSN